MPPSIEDNENSCHKVMHEDECLRRLPPTMMGIQLFIPTCLKRKINTENNPLCSCFCSINRATAYLKITYKWDQYFLNQFLHNYSDYNTLIVPLYKNYALASILLTCMHRVVWATHGYNFVYMEYTWATDFYLNSEQINTSYSTWHLDQNVSEL
jgi:hypothetical protein